MPVAQLDVALLREDQKLALQRIVMRQGRDHRLPADRDDEVLGVQLLDRLEQRLFPIVPCADRAVGCGSAALGAGSGAGSRISPSALSSPRMRRG